MSAEGLGATDRLRVEEPASRPTTLRVRLRRALTAAGVLLGVLGLAALAAMVQMVRAQDAVTDLYYGAITEASSGYIRLLDAESAVRGYALTADEGRLDRYREALAGGESTAELEAALAQDPVLARSRAEAVAAARAWVTEFAEPTVEAVEAGGVGAVTAADIERGGVLFDETRDRVESYLDAIREQRAGALDRLERWTALLMGATLALLLGAVAVGFMLRVALERWITRPLADLAADARHVSSGDLLHPVRASGPGEIAALADDVETMRRYLVREVEQTATASAELAEAHRLLTEQAAELQRSNRDLEQFAYVASHDLQEPLRKVASFTQLLQKRYGGQLDERADQYIDFAVDGAKRMQRLIQDLLGFSRVGRLGGEPADVDLDDALADALANLAESVRESGAVVEAADLPVVRGEHALLVQLLQNLIGNAVKFRDPDRTPHVRLSARRVDGAWELECRDNGIGIDDQYAERVFVIFQRLHAKEAYEGTGIGLSLCKKIVEHHGGHIWLEPVVDGPGTSVRWTLPAVPDDALPPAGGTAAAPQTDQRTTAVGR